MAAHIEDSATPSLTSETSKSSNFSLESAITPVLESKSESEERLSEIDKSLIEMMQELPSFPSDHRRYRYLILKNGLKVLLIQNNKASLATAHMDVGMGSYHEPKQHLGLAHFLEHLLFRGSEKYPNKSEYQENVKLLGGACNGTTFDPNTHYYFSIENNHLSAILDRFLQFFVAPLFRKTCSHDEISAMQEEFMKNLNLDSFRLMHVAKSIVNPEHPECLFNWGNADTLNERNMDNIIESMKSLYERFYKANNMIFVLESSLSLDKQLALVLNPLSIIPKSESPMPSLPKIPRYTADRRTLIHQKSVANNDSLFFNFIFQSNETIELHQSMDYIESLFHSGEGSLFLLLKQKGWVQEYSAGGNVSLSTNTEFHDGIQVEFSVVFPLTEEGKNKKTEITYYLFKFIDFLKRDGIHEKLFQELKRLTQSVLLTKAGSLNEISDFVRHLKEYTLDKFFVGNLTVENSIFPVDYISKILESLSVNNLQTVVFFDSNEDIFKNDTSIVEPYTKTQYQIKPLAMFLDDQKTVKESESISFKLPKSNRFAPTNFSIVPMAAKYKTPRLVHDEDNCRVFVSQDLHLQRPTIKTQCVLVNQQVRSTPLNFLIAEVLTVIITEEFNIKFNHDLELSNANYNFTTGNQGFCLSVNSFSHYHSEIIQTFFNFLDSFQCNEENFKKGLDFVISFYQALDLKTGLEQARSMLGNMLNGFIHTDQILKVADQVNLKLVIEFWERIKKQFKYVVYSHGNVADSEAVTFGKNIAQLFSNHEKRMPEFAVSDFTKCLKRHIDNLNNSLYCNTTPRSAVIRLPSNSRFYFTLHVAQQNSAVSLLLQAPNRDLKTRLLIMLLNVILQPVLFQELRTKEKLAYTVYSEVFYVDHFPGLSLNIESSTASAAFLLTRLKAFLENFKKYLAEFPLEKFTSLQETCNKQYRDQLINPESPDSYANVFSNYLIYGIYSFDELLENMQPYQFITLSMLQGFFNSLAFNNTQQLAILAESSYNPSIQQDNGMIVGDEGDDNEENISTDIEKEVATKELGELEENMNSASTNLTDPHLKRVAPIPAEFVSIAEIQAFKQKAAYFPCYMQEGEKYFKERYQKTKPVVLEKPEKLSPKFLGFTKMNTRVEVYKATFHFPAGTSHELIDRFKVHS